MTMTTISPYSSLTSERNGEAPTVVQKPPRTLANRACSECRRKKSRCDMKRPECSLCWRIGASCVYPTRRAPGRKKTIASRSIIEPSKNQQQHGPPSPHINKTFADDHITFDVPSFSNNWDNCLPSPTLPSLNGSTDRFFLTSDINFLTTEFDDLSGMSWIEDEHSVEVPERSVSDTGMIAGLDYSRELPTTTSHTAVAKQSQNLHDEPLSYDIDISPTTAQELVDKFFGHVHYYLPLLHRDKFMAEHKHILCSTAEKLCDLPWETAFLFCSIFALSARFSTSEEFGNEPPIQRGDRFTLQATQLFDSSTSQLENSTPSMPYLQASILLTFFTVQSSPSRQAWLRSSICFRLAYELELHMIDADIVSGDVKIDNLTSEEYSLREERRRAWWVIWDIDTFLSFMALRPSAAGHHKFQVLLPVPDEVWLSGKMVPSTYLESDHAIPWRRLCDSPNQSAWAWFLASTTIARQVTDILLSPSPSEGVLEEVEAKIGCYALALPECFRLDLDPVRPSSEQAQGMNWIISSLLVTESLRALIAVRRKSANLSKWHRDSQSPDDSTVPANNAIRSQNISVFGDLRHEVAHWIRHWPVTCFTQCSPLICACLIGPALSYAGEGENLSGTLDHLDRETIILAMKRLARHWMISKVLLDKLDHMKEGQVSLTTEQTSEQALRRHWRSTMIW